MSRGSIAGAVVVMTILGLGFAVGWVAHGASVIEADSTSVGGVDRVVDHEADVVCYRTGHTDGGVDCLPLNETSLSTQEAGDS